MKKLFLISYLTLVSCSNPEGDIKNLNEHVFRDNVFRLIKCGLASTISSHSEDKYSESYKQDFIAYKKEATRNLVARLCDVNNDLNLSISCRDTIPRAYKGSNKSEDELTRITNSRCPLINNTDYELSETCIESVRNYERKYIDPLLKAHINEYYRSYTREVSNDEQIILAQQYIARNCN
ncbi:MAG: hypothetical protein H7A09_04055 [Oceanospirillaceae bacterium]|nr:hypothetical protein [Oceanospirillaceae bacterium]MCP5335240.1 hypothetical protein [Oceanospirillaceae bacterium]